MIPFHAYRCSPLVLALLAALQVGCGSEPTTTGETDAARDAGIDTSAGCADSADCDAGGLCVEGVCTPCSADDQCISDAHYGEGAVCEDGACIPCDAGEDTCACLSNGMCDEGLQCTDEGCVPCEDGVEQCPCDQGECAAGLACVEGLCVPVECTIGADGCPCDGDVCDEGLFCGDNGLCAECTNEIAGCPCLLGECENGMICDDDLCRDPLVCADLACAESQVCAEALSGQDAVCLPECEGDLVWNAEDASCDEPSLSTCGESPDVADVCAGLFRSCDDTEAGAECGDCLPFYGEGGGEACVELSGCAEIGLACADVQNRSCVERTATSAAECGGCLAGYSDDEGVCAATAGATCEEGAGASISAACRELNRACVEDPAATCGECLEGFEPAFPGDRAGACEPPGVPCSSLSCEDDEYCVEAVGSTDAYCETRPCPVGEAFGGVAGGVCVDCGAGCAALEGQTGRVWPYTAAGSNSCICETTEGYFFSTTGTRTAARCDDDGDGWVSDSALREFESGDVNRRANARCDVRYIDRFRLQNEYSETKDIYLCADGSLQDSPCVSPGTIALAEADDLDRQSELENRIAEDPVSYPVYGSGETPRALTARELNPLTRVCVTPGADYNADGVPDVSEGHDPAAGPFANMSFFVELHTSHYAGRRDGSGLGAYVIAERSRCDADFPLTYEGTGPDGGAWGREYHRDCARNRRGDYDERAESQAGFDFARWGCDASLGTCPLAPPLIRGVAPEGSTQPPPHGLCEGEAEPDGAWRGMNHHSQFRCSVVTDTPVSERPELITPDALAALGWLNACSLSDEGPDLSTRPEPATPAVSNLRCEVDDVLAAGATGFVAVGYRGGFDYAAGCIDEWSSPRTDEEKIAWRQMCEGFTETAIDAEIGFGREDAFGAMVCGCDSTLGGVGCAWRCLPEEVHVGGVTSEEELDCVSRPDGTEGFCTVGSDGQRVGYWMCTQPTLTETGPLPGLFEQPVVGAALPDEGYALFGGVRPGGVVRQRLCEVTDTDGGCSGFSVR